MCGDAACLATGSPNLRSGQESQPKRGTQRTAPRQRRPGLQSRRVNALSQKGGATYPEQ